MGMLRSTGVVALSTLISRILGFVRDMVFAGYFGANRFTDAFFVAFRIPNLLRRLVAEGALTISFIPVYTDYLVKSGKDEALILAQKVLSVLSVVVFGLIVLGEVFSPEIVKLFAWGFTDPASISLAVDLNRVMFPYLFFVSFVAFSMGLLNSHSFFFAPAFAPVLLNVGMIFGIVFLSNFFVEPLYGVAVGVIIGGIMQFIMQIPYLARAGFKMKLSVDFNHAGIRKIFRLIAPALFGIAVYQVNILMSTILASFLPSGSITYLYYSDRLTEIVLGIFIVSIGNVILPEMSRMRASDDMDKFKQLYISAARASLFLGIPAAAGLMAAGFPIVSTLFMRGEFSAADSALTERALFYSSMGIGAISLIRITTPTFYALKDTKMPVISAAVSFVINITLGWILMHTALKHAGLSLANTISVTVQTFILVTALGRKVGGLGFSQLIKPAAKYITASALMAAAVFYLCGLVDWKNDSLIVRILSLGAIVSAGGGIYAAACTVLRVEEIKFLASRLPVVKRFVKK